MSSFFANGLDDMDKTKLPHSVEATVPLFSGGMSTYSFNEQSTLKRAK